MSYTVPKILGQNKPDAGVDTNLFTVASNHQVQFSLFACNQSAVIDRFTIALIPNGGTETNATYIAYNTPLIGNGMFSAAGLYLNSGDQVKVSSVNGSFSFTATGIDIIP
jgi:hypothetical protein